MELRYSKIGVVLCRWRKCCPEGEVLQIDDGSEPGCIHDYEAEVVDLGKPRGRWNWKGRSVE